MLPSAPTRHRYRLRQARNLLVSRSKGSTSTSLPEHEDTSRRARAHDFELRKAATFDLGARPRRVARDRRESAGSFATAHSTGHWQQESRKSKRRNSSSSLKV